MEYREYVILPATDEYGGFIVTGPKCSGYRAKSVIEAERYVDDMKLVDAIQEKQREQTQHSNRSR